MKCLVHNQEDAVSTCKVCGSGLCAECTRRFDSPMCESCLLSHNGSIKKSLVMDLVISAVVFCIAFSLFKEDGTLDSTILFSYFCAAIPWGWSFIGGRPSLFMWLSSNMVVGYYITKFFLALTIGAFAFPVVLFLKIRELLKINQIKKAIYQGNL